MQKRAQKKKTVKKVKSKKGLKGLLFYFGLITLLSLLAYGYQTINTHLNEQLSTFKIENIKVEGNHILSKAEVLGLLGIGKEVKLLDIAPKNVAEKLVISPFIEAASAVYSLPSTLRITIKERKPVAFIYGRGLNLIDANNFIMPVPQTNMSWNLPIIRGIKQKLGVQGAITTSKQAQLAVEITSFIQLLDMPLKEMVSQLNFNSKHYVEIGLSGTRTVIRVDAHNYQDQLYVAAKYLKEYMDFNKLNRLEYVDVRFKNQIVIKEKKA